MTRATFRARPLDLFGASVYPRARDADAAAEVKRRQRPCVPGREDGDEIYL